VENTGKYLFCQQKEAGGEAGKIFEGLPDQVGGFSVNR
jgi:hypothetical protein